MASNSCCCSRASPARNSPKIDADQQQHREQPEEGEVGDPRGHQVALRALVAAAGAGQVVEPGPAPPQPGDQRLAPGVQPGEQRLAPGLAGGAELTGRVWGLPARRRASCQRGGPVSRYSRATAQAPLGVCSNSVNELDREHRRQVGQPAVGELQHVARARRGPP